ncbi:DUF6044 family protein [Candidatus Omnitrophota bacterium]
MISSTDKKGTISLTSKKGFLFLLVALYISIEYFGFGPLSYVRIHDTADSFIPRYLTLKYSLFKYGVSYWCPSMGCGVDRLANDMLFPHFTTILFNIFPGWIAYQLIIIIQKFFAGYFTYRLSRDYLRLSEATSMYAGIAFALFVSDLINFQLGFAAFPFVLWAIERICERFRRSQYVWMVILGIFYSFCSSFVFSIPFTLPMVLLWFIIIRKRFNISFLKLFTVFCSVVILCHTFEIWSLMIHAGMSHRIAWRHRTFLGKGPIECLSLSAIILKGIKSLLLYKLAAILAIVACIVSRFRSKLIIYLFSLYGFCTMGVVLIKQFALNISNVIPFLENYQFDRFYELTPFFAVLCTASGLDIIISHLKNMKAIRYSKNRPLLKTLPTIILTVFFVFLLYSSLQIKMDNLRTWIDGANYSNQFDVRIIHDISKKDGLKPFRVATVYYAGLHPAYSNAYGFETADSYINLYPKTYHSFWSKVIKSLMEQEAHRYDYFMFWGNRIYLFAPKIFKDNLVFGDYYNSNLLSLLNIKYIISKIPLIDKNLSLIAEQRIARVGPPFIHELTCRIYGRSTRSYILRIYENKACLPRFFMVKNVKTFNTSEDLFDNIGKAEVQSLRSSLYLEKKYANTIRPSSKKYSKYDIVIKKYTPDKIVLSVDQDGPGILIASNTYSPYWKCRVNSEDIDIFPAYGTLWGIYLEGGSKEVVFYYDPPYNIINKFLRRI